MRKHNYPSPADFAILPRAPKNASRVPELTSLYHNPLRGDYGDARYPGNCSGNLIRDLLRYYRPLSVWDPMTGSGTCRDVCEEMGIACDSSDLRDGVDACNWDVVPRFKAFDFIWVHPPYWRQKKYSNDRNDLSNDPTLDSFLFRMGLFLANCRAMLKPTGHLAVLMGDYSDQEVGFVPLTFHLKKLAFERHFRQSTTDIIRFSHGASSSTKTYRSSFIPGLHDVCTVFEHAPVREKVKRTTES